MGIVPRVYIFVVCIVVLNLPLLSIGCGLMGTHSLDREVGGSKPVWVAIFLIMM